MPVSSIRRTRVISRLARWTRAAWSLLGLTILLILAVEGLLRLGFAAKDAIRPLPPIDPRVVAEGYGGAPWVEDLYRELNTIEMERAPYVEFHAKPFAGRFHKSVVGGARRTWQNPRENEGVHPAAAPEVLFLGGSSAWGWGARDEETIPSQLAKQLADAEISARVTNLAQIGYVSTQEWLLLSVWLRAGHKPDVVVTYGGVNDVLATYQNGRAGWPQNEANRRREFNILSSPRRLMGALAGNLVSGSALFRLATSAARRLGVEPGPRPAAGDPSALPDATAAAYAENLRALAELGREHGFAVLAYGQPVLFTKRTMTPFEREKSSQYDWLREPVLQTKARLAEVVGTLPDPAHLSPSPLAGEGRGGGAVDRSLTGRTTPHPDPPPQGGREPEGEGLVRYRDLGGLFDETDDLVFTDFCHTTEAANAAIAAAIAPDVIEALRGRTPP
jgi:lysophospholipase L1-like esterase